MNKFSSPFMAKSPLLNGSRTNKEKGDAVEDSEEKRVSTESGASSGEQATQRDYIKGGRVKKAGEGDKPPTRERKVSTEFNTFDAGETYTKTKTITKKSGEVKVKKRKISAKKAKRQAERLDKKYIRV